MSFALLHSRTVGLTAAVGIVAGVALGRWLGRRHSLLKLRLALSTAKRLSNVRVPVALLPHNSGLSADAEGLILCDVAIDSQGKISAVKAATGKASIGAIDCGGAVLVSCFTDAHTHMVKTHAHPRTRNPTGSVSDALAIELEDQPRWAACPCCRPLAFAAGGAANANADADESCVPCPKATDVLRRMDFALASAYHHGTRAVRTHLDGTSVPDAKTRATVYAAFAANRTKWGRRGLEVQGVANLYLPLWAQPALAEAHVAEAVKYEGVLLGAYCGNVNGTPAHETEAAFDALFSYAQTHTLAVDLHIDETNDTECCGLRPLVTSLKKARAKGYAQPVLLGHCTSLAIVSPAWRDEVVRGLSGIADVTVVCNPSTNLGLQDRRGSAVPHCAPVDAGTPRTPLWRGVTSIQELSASGVLVGAASDNVRDHWHAYGDYDGLSTWKGAITLGHLDTAPSEGAWAHIVSDAPAKAMGLMAADACAFTAGSAADLILFPDANRLSEVLSRPQADRIVLRGGRVQQSALPSYRELDDLVATPTALGPEWARAAAARPVVQRGATATKTVYDQ